jgi:cytochrome c biogenesis protein CcdA
MGLGLGLLHAFESDHVAAVTTLIAQGGGTRRAAWLGASWGLGHAIPLVVVGTLLISLGIEVPASIAGCLDLVVVVMLLALGVRSIVAARLFSPPPSSSLEHHPTGLHTHRPDESPHAHATGDRVRTPMGAMLVGAVHGASGTAAVAVAWLMTMPRAVGVLYLSVYAAGAALGMTLLSALLTLPLGAMLRLWPASGRALRVSTGVLSLIAACVLLARISAG